MKQQILLLTFFFLFIGNMQAQCPPSGTITLSTQAEIDAFSTNYPNCTDLSELRVEGADISNLDGLSQLTRISDEPGHLLISNCINLTNIQGLNNVEFVGNLIITNNNSLISLDGLQNIDYVYGCLDIAYNQNLSNIQALNNFDFYLSDNAGYTCWWEEYDPYYGYSYLHEYKIHIHDNTNLAECALQSFCNSWFGSNFNWFYNNGSQECNWGGYVQQACEANYCISDVILETQADVDNFSMNYPCSDSILSRLYIGPATGTSDITDLSPLSQVTYVEGLIIRNNSLLTSLNGLEQIVMGQEQQLALGSLEINNNDALPNLDGLTIDYVNNVEIIDNDVLIRLFTPGSCVDMQLDLTISDNALLDNITGFECLDTLRGLYISNNASLNSLEGFFDNLEAIRVRLSITDSPVLTDLSGLESITFLGELLLQNNTALTSLSGLEGLQLLEETPNSSNSNLWINSNPQLSLCGYPAICTYLLGGSGRIIENNAPGCNTSNEILSSCDFSYVDIQTFYDINQNQIQDINEPDMETIVEIQPQGNTYYINDNFLYLSSGNYTITFDETAYPDWTLTTDSISYFVTIEANEPATISFGWYPDALLSDVQSIVNSPPARCNELITFDVNTKNLGTTIADGLMWLEVDENILATNFIDTPDTTVAPNLYGWFFEDLYPSQCLSRQIELQIPGPPDFPLGDYIVFNAYADFEDENGGQSSQNFTYAAEVRCSYDPNDKLVNPAREGNYTLFDENLMYTIRFQNTGNDVAYDVVIRDTLDTNLDLESFNVLGSSHADKLQTNMTEEGILTFEFRNIFLPDSTSNLEGSQGYVTYMINAIDGLAENTPISNSAGIYFDLNPPILTNTTQNVMVSELPVVSNTSPDKLPDFTITPNPSTGIFRVNGIPQGSYQIHDTTGRIIQSGAMKNDLSIDISEEVQGVYFISIQMNNETITKRIIKM